MNNIDKLTIAGLLHDIGKVVRRSDTLKSDHTRQGLDFLKDNAINISDKDEILRMIRNHHAKYLKDAKLPNDDLSYIIYEADNIASGIDRREHDDEGLGDEMMALKSIFTALKPDKSSKNYYISPDPLREEDILIPSSDGNDSMATTREYYKIKDEHIKSNLRGMQIDSDSINSLLGLLEATTSSIPSSSFVDRPDIPLYDHSKMTAAIANNLYLYFESIGEYNYKSMCFSNSDNIQNLRKSDSMIFVSGELSGVQSFIYSITSKNAMKSLRGRSFYLEILTENVIDEILSAMGLNRSNLIYSGGSSFIMLLPNTNEAENVLKQTKKRVNEFLLDRYSIDIYFEISNTPCSAEDLANGLNSKNRNFNKLGELYRNNSMQMSKSKMNRYSDEQLTRLFDPDSDINTLEDNSKECPVCKASKRLIKSEYYEGSSICKSCFDFIELGKSLAKSSNEKEVFYFIFSDEDDNLEKLSSISLDMPTFNENVKGKLSLISQEKAEIYLKNNNVKRIYSINSKTIGKNITSNIWIGDYNVPSKDGRGLIEFDELVNRCGGIKRLAVFRADIDDLGATFASGFEDKSSADNRYKNSSVSRIATLSRMLSEFFKKNINQIAERKFTIDGYESCNLITCSNIERNIVIVYSGGDDVFAIGTWSDIIEFSIDLREIFALYTIDKLSFSAGIGFFKNGYPVSQMALNTGKLEALAKENPNKNSVALFGIGAKDSSGDEESHVYEWNEFIDDVMNEKYTRLKKWFYFDEREKLEGKLFAGKSFLYRLLNLVRINLDKGSKKVDLARLVYTISRIKYTKETEDVYLESRENIINWFKDKNELKKLLTALNLIIYEIRE